jgi:hypothetical protein
VAEQIQIMTPYGPTEALHWYLTDREVMWQTLKELIDAHGHRGALVEWPDTSGEPVWRIEVNDDAGNTTSGVFGDHLVMPVGDHVSVYGQMYFESIRMTEGE